MGDPHHAGTIYTVSEAALATVKKEAVDPKAA